MSTVCSECIESVSTIDIPARAWEGMMSAVCSEYSTVCSELHVHGRA
jgi:hypothetical protein